MKHLVFLLGAVFVFGFAGPMLISAKSHELALMGTAMVVVFILIGVRIYKKELTNAIKIGRDIAGFPDAGSDVDELQQSPSGERRD